MHLGVYSRLQCSSSGLPLHPLPGGGTLDDYCSIHGRIDEIQRAGTTLTSAAPASGIAAEAALAVPF